MESNWTRTEAQQSTRRFPFFLADGHAAMTLTRPLCALACLFVVGILLGGPAIHAQDTRTVSDSIGLHRDGTVKVAITNGSVHVRPWDRPVVSVTARITGTGEGQGQTSGINTDGDSTEVSIRAGGADPDGVGFFEFLGFGSGGGAAIDLSLRVPREAMVRISAESGSVDVEGLQGEAVVEGGSPEVRIRDMDGRVVVGTFSGTLDAENVRGELIFGTFSGSLTLRGSDLPSSCKVGTFSGDAEFAFPSDAGFDLKTDISWGGVTSDFVLPDSSADDDGKMQIGGGGPMIVFESFTGDLTLLAE